MSGMITEVERFALNDGPGIRTTVFLKGCNMHCAWCHNPETIRGERDILYNPAKCIGCSHCVPVCPTQAQQCVDGLHLYLPALCTRCGKCAEVCYAEAMTASGSLRTVEEVMCEVRQDIPYYRSSGGGVTLSGGEVLCQPAFAASLIAACRAENIPVAVETNLNFPWEEIEPLIRSLDLVMCDLKLFDSAAHRRWTGVGNETIKRSIAALAESGVPFLVRTPLIPGATDDEENIRAIARFLAQVNVKNTLLYYELLNFNPLGKVKYDGMQLPNPFENAKPLPRPALLKLQGAAAEAGIQTRIA